eukprot:scaffold148_cov341-Pavlova_lutheri.AAC.53
MHVHESTLHREARLGSFVRAFVRWFVFSFLVRKGGTCRRRVSFHFGSERRRIALVGWAQEDGGTRPGVEGVQEGFGALPGRASTRGARVAAAGAGSGRPAAQRQGDATCGVSQRSRGTGPGAERHGQRHTGGAEPRHAGGEGVRVPLQRRQRETDRHGEPQQAARIHQEGNWQEDEAQDGARSAVRVRRHVRKEQPRPGTAGPHRTGTRRRRGLAAAADRRRRGRRRWTGKRETHVMVARDTSNERDECTETTQLPLHRTK